MVVATSRLDGNPGRRILALSGSLRLRNLGKVYPPRGRRLGQGIPVEALAGISLSIPQGSTVAVVGISGSGKSTLGRCVALLEPPTSGQIYWGEEELTALSGSDLKQARRRIQMIFQDPVSALEPRFTVAEAVAEPLDILRAGNPDQRRLRVLEKLAEVDLLPELADRRVGELSGGQKQRVSIARALIGEPRILVVDEGLASLDLSTRSRVSNLLLDLQAKYRLTYLLISHDLRWAAHLADRVVVLDRGRVVESTSPGELLDRPRSKAGRALVAATEVDNPFRA